MTSHSKPGPVKWSLTPDEITRAEACACRSILTVSEYIRHAVVSRCRNVDDWEQVFVPHLDRSGATEITIMLTGEERDMIAAVAKHRNVTMRNLVAHILNERLDEDERHDGPRDIPVPPPPRRTKEATRRIVNVAFASGEHKRVVALAKEDGRTKSNMVRVAALTVAKGRISERPLRVRASDDVRDCVCVSLVAHDYQIIEAAAKLNGRKVRGFMRWATLQYLESEKAREFATQMGD